MYSVQSYDDKDTFSVYDQKKIDRAEEQEYIVGLLKQIYQVVVPIVCVFLAVVKCVLVIRLFFKLATKSIWVVKRDWYAKLGPALNPYHLVLLDLLSSGLFLVIPLWVFLLRKKISLSFLLLNIVCFGALSFIMLFFTSFGGSMWLFGINIAVYCIFILIDVVLQKMFNVHVMLSHSYSV
ncbi:hypothetical protein ENUP19_0050G0028 [Entamoeba nuttalli]|uniref:Uncharacterized protein n=2 Tax=Entamoeba nuttalli TaxID=412467 RepID=K2HWJ8_ENTNP|nr:hypothetical protein ENU1_085330 [Entamoeba nuttalli P19]EKE40615.1 hypothetical protein ENU1_085330 [Entamoeba nuttalli P19]|eukprot:XP_008857048.1 hypothetical protein ENU1_085330 [Entamoeba nuttalli P19]